MVQNDSMIYPNLLFEYDLTYLGETAFIVFQKCAFYMCLKCYTLIISMGLHQN